MADLGFTPPALPLLFDCGDMALKLLFLVLLYAPVKDVAGLGGFVGETTMFNPTCEPAFVLAGRLA